MGKKKKQDKQDKQEKLKKSKQKVQKPAKHDKHTKTEQKAKNSIVKEETADRQDIKEATAVTAEKKESLLKKSGQKQKVSTAEKLEQKSKAGTAEKQKQKPKASTSGKTLRNAESNPSQPDMAVVFRAFGDAHRLQILDMLKEQELSAGELLESLDIVQSTLSHHMKFLTEAGIVKCRKMGKWSYYSIDRDKLAQVSEYILKWS